MSDLMISQLGPKHTILKWALLLLGVIVIAGVVLVSYRSASPQQVSVATPSVIKQSSPEKINGIVVPPEPDQAYVDLTLEGVDINSNGVRDEIERYIAVNVSNQKDYDLAFNHAKFFCQLSSYPVTGTKEDALGIAMLIPSGDATSKIKEKFGTDFLSELQSKILNTNGRNERYNRVFSIVFNPDLAIEAKQCTPSAVMFGVVIPPEPDSLENERTLIGVDSNNNHVRDDVERLIACNVVSTNDFIASLAGARAYQKIFELPEAVLSKNVLVDIYGDLYCAEKSIQDSNIDGAWQLERDLGRATFNTETRRKVLSQKKTDFGGFMSTELKKCPDGI